MVDSRALLGDLRRLVVTLAGPLGEETKSPEVDDRWRAEWRRATAGRPAIAYEAWRDEQVTQTAMAWVLATVFLRFCEDNELIEAPFLAGPEERVALARDRQAEYERTHPERCDRDWITEGIREIARAPAARPVFEAANNPMWRLGLTVSAGQSLLAFWRRVDNKGGVRHDFTDPRLDTSFLGDLYQGLSDEARKNYAFVQTPDFVEEFILDRTLEPAIVENGLAGLRFIDPACGSGSFLLGAFDRLVEKWRTAEPGTDRWVVVSRALNSVHGVDKSFFAATVARLRLLIGILRQGGARRLGEIPEFPLVVVVGDSLIHGRTKPSEAPGAAELHYQPTENLEHFSRAPDELLALGSYDVVVSAPPYVTVTDAQEHASYRRVYGEICSGKFTLSIPFIRLLFDLVRPDSAERKGVGRVGLLTPDSFAKREFGRKLVENFLAVRVVLDQVIDLSGAFIPGHGTPTLILVGRRRQPRDGRQTRVIVSVRGEPSVPVDAARGHVWRSILAHDREHSGTSPWTRAFHLDQKELRAFPWNLASRETKSIVESMGGRRLLKDIVARIGYRANTGSDDLFTASPATLTRLAAEQRFTVDVITGSDVRDWCAVTKRKAFFPGKAPELPDAALCFAHLKRLWPYRTVLGKRPNYTRRSFFEDGRTWYEWHQFASSKKRGKWSIVFPWVATHNHFSTVGSQLTPLHSAPVIEFHEGSEPPVELTALLNTSAVCFWLKQHSHSKGRPNAKQTGSGEPWTLFYEFTATRIGELPVPDVLPHRYSRELHDLAHELVRLSPRNALGAPTAGQLESSLARTRDHWIAVRSRMIALQEELDWETYASYGLVEAAAGLGAPPESVPDLRPGERAFEIVLARELEAGRSSTTWFERHEIDPITEPPRHWGATYRATVLRRIAAITADPTLAVLESPAHKRRWASLRWDQMQTETIREWLLDCCETPALWHSPQGMPRPLTATQIAEALGEDPLVAEMADLYAPGQFLADVIAGLLSDQHVPYVAAWRYRESGLRKREAWEHTWRLQRNEDRARARGEDAKAEQVRRDTPAPPKYTSADYYRVSYWHRRGKYDVPEERFISYPPIRPGDESLFGWAGWSHLERAEVVRGLIDLHEEEHPFIEASADDFAPYLAGLRELVPWVQQWHGAPYADELRQYLTERLNLHGLSEDDLACWRPPQSRRGRPRKA